MGIHAPGRIRMITDRETKERKKRKRKISRIHKSLDEKLITMETIIGLIRKDLEDLRKRIRKLEGEIL
jgi:hypothetical protein